ncbi:hypothetical protein CMV30_08855 [Nibricoccus aquaticus]|uniref:DUF4832 domain-containing protein n=1 Tax=Nibricoccus aquaticus TaxID=2576891 RepID=A0A290QA23_9BACT|nr:DUF3142 domain-containing protein [Nibricoccus aquaticus]ATC64050.1 hypothetical protein CMV30_08855 [Nibricoccus aquaticus]
MKCRHLLFFVSLLLSWSAATASLPQDVYVWQRQWTEAVNASLGKIRDDVGRVHVLAAEVNWKSGRMEVFRAEPDYAVLKRLGVEVGLVVRIGPYGGPFARGDAVTSRLKEIVEERLRAARDAGLEPAELQMDFDCAEAKLADYREWLLALREAAGAVPLVFTALPAWLRHEREFRALAETADGFVLQVHSLEKPRGVNEPVVLCDPARSRVWALQASRAGVPFRVALPTYGYEVGFAADGKFIGLAAEGSRRSWPEGAQIREVRADVEAMRVLARELEESALADFAGVIWFRLPVEGDRLNWDVRTLVALTRGEQPQVCLRAGIAWSEGDAGRAEIYVENAGDMNVALPKRLVAKWPAGARVLALDALAGYSLMAGAAGGGATFAMGEAAQLAVLAPGRRRRVGWIRFSHEISLQIEIIAESSRA